jgi:hypothetical protein
MQTKNNLVFCTGKWKKSFEEMRNKKATAVDDVPGNGLRLPEKDCMKNDNTTDQQHVRNSRVAR